MIYRIKCLSAYNLLLPNLRYIETSSNFWTWINIYIIFLYFIIDYYPRSTWLQSCTHIVIIFNTILTGNMIVFEPNINSNVTGKYLLINRSNSYCFRTKSKYGTNQTLLIVVRSVVEKSLKESWPFQLEMKY